MSWLDVIGAAQDALPPISAAGFIAVLYLGTKFVRHSKCNDHRQSLAAELGAGLKGNDARRKELQRVIDGLPTALDISALRVAMATMEGSQKALQEQISGVETLVERVESSVQMVVRHLMEAKK